MSSMSNNNNNNNVHIVKMKPENIFLFVPNLIGYARIGMILLSMKFMQTKPWAAFLCYWIGSLMDEVDGRAARKFNQCTQFGNMLDQLTDRIGTSILLMMLATLYPNYACLFQLSMGIDISMHWIHLHVSAMEGKDTHKVMTKEEPWLLRYYYDSDSFLSVMCNGNEMFYLGLYMCYHYETVLWKLVATMCFPIAALKLYIALLQGVHAARKLGVMDQMERMRLRIKEQKLLVKREGKIDENGQSFPQKTVTTGFGGIRDTVIQQRMGGGGDSMRVVVQGKDLKCCS